ncbi:MAG: hypothetical protein JXD23_05800 [Spirochaetales bacterium]|nr:hypothetical protein [Spirochaetales bacterium]
MVVKSKFEELSGTLTDIERKELLDKIHKSMEGSDGEYYIHVDLEEEEKKRLIREEIGSLSLWRRFVLWVLKTLTGRDRDQVFLSMKISEIKRSVRRTNPGLTGFETRELTVKFVKCVYDLYTAVWPVIEFYQYYVNEPSFREQLVFGLFSSVYDQAKHRLEDFIEPEELEEVFAQANGQQGIQNMLSKRFDEYMKSLPGSIFQKLDAEITPIIAMKNVALFNYKELFQYFDYYLPHTLEKKYPFFRSAPAMVVIDHLERLYYSIYYALKNTENSTAVNEQVMSAYYVARTLGIDPARGGQELARRRGEVERETHLLRVNIQALIEETMRFYAQVPLLDIIKYFRRDPYFRFKFYIPVLPLRQIYSQALRKLLRSEVDGRISEIKGRVIDRKIRELFRDLSLTPFVNATEDGAEFYLRLSLPYFSRLRSLNLLANYIRKVYREFIHDVVQVVSQYFFTTNKRNQNRLLQYASAIEEVDEKIAQYDKSLSPEEDDGKTMLRLRYNIANDFTHQKLYKAFLSDKDRDAQDILERGIEQFAGFKNIFDEILASAAEGVQSALKTPVVYKSKQYTLGQLLQLMSLNVGDFLKILNQVMEMEKGHS